MKYLLLRISSTTESFKVITLSRGQKSKTEAMAFKGILQLCMLFSLAWIILETEADSYEIFKKRHLDYPKTVPPKGVTYCKYMLKARGLLHKISHLFIHVPEKTLKKICPKNYEDGPRTSLETYPVTQCANGRLRYLGITNTARVVVYCRDKLPIELRTVKVPPLPSTSG